MSLISELRRRNVFRVATLYVVVTWLILQVVDVAAPMLLLPDWVGRFVLLILLVGFVPVLVFSWAYEITPEGIKLEKDVDRTGAAAGAAGRRLDRMIIIGLAAVIVVLVGERFLVSPEGLRSEARQPKSGDLRGPDAEVSIAVLPFVNMSPDPNQEYFSDGMTEEILNALVKVPGLLVAARTSVFAYKGRQKDVREIGAELGVEAIVEGSVRKAGNDLRITAQLIRVEDGFHLWSESYDRRLENVFAVQNEIATAIAEALQAPLGLGRPLITNRMADIDAYDLYLQARQMIRMRDEFIEKAIRKLQDIVSREPDFAPAWASLALALEMLPYYQDSFDGEPLALQSILERAEVAARKAVELDSELAEAQLALGAVLRAKRQWSEAEDAYLRAHAIDPRSIDVLEDYRQFLRIVGKLNQALVLARRGYELEPRSSLAAVAYGDLLISVRRFDAAMEILDRALELNPGARWPTTRLTEIQIFRGHYGRALELLRECTACEKAPFMAETKAILAALRDGQEVQSDRDLALYGLGLSSLLHAVGGDELVMRSYELRTDPTVSVTDLGANLPFMDRIRATERYRRFAEELGLAAYWRERGWPDYCWPAADGGFECGAFKLAEN